MPVFLLTRLRSTFSARSPENSSPISRSASLDNFMLYEESIVKPGKSASRFILIKSSRKIMECFSFMDGKRMNLGNLSVGIFTMAWRALFFFEGSSCRGDFL